MRSTRIPQSIAIYALESVARTLLTPTPSWRASWVESTRKWQDNRKDEQTRKCQSEHICKLSPGRRPQGGQWRKKGQSRSFSIVRLGGQRTREAKFREWRIRLLSATSHMK